MRRMIAKEQMILEEGILITFHHAKRRQTIGDVQVKKGDTVLHQIANAEPGSGNAKVILQNFFEALIPTHGVPLDPRTSRGSKDGNKFDVQLDKSPLTTESPLISTKGEVDAIVPATTSV